MKGTLVNHVDRQFAKAWASKRGLGCVKHVMLEYVLVQEVVEQTKHTCQHEVEHSRLHDKVRHLRSAHEKFAMLGLKLSGKLACNCPKRRELWTKVS